VAHDYYEGDNYPLGTNAVVAVISYTGYDMEDAMILNKASVERGFKHGSIYKTEIVDLRELAGVKGKSTEIVYQFGRKEDHTSLDGFVDLDGLPFIGTKVEYESRSVVISTPPPARPKSRNINPWKRPSFTTSNSWAMILADQCSNRWPSPTGSIGRPSLVTSLPTDTDRRGSAVFSALRRTCRSLRAV